MGKQEACAGGKHGADFRYRQLGKRQGSRSNPVIKGNRGRANTVVTIKKRQHCARHDDGLRYGSLEARPGPAWPTVRKIPQRQPDRPGRQ